MTETDQIVLGIDPGNSVTGYGIIHIKGKNVKLLSAGVIELSKRDDQYVKLKKIFSETLRLIDTYKPDELSIEAPFYAKNIQSMLKLGRAQGMAIAAALHRSIPVFEYSAKKIKMAITGNGNAAKEQVAGFLKALLGISNLPTSLDATDGLAAAVCHFYQKGIPNKEKKVNSWKDFINKNPSRKL